MPGEVDVALPGRVGELTDWSADLSAMPHSPVQGNPATGSVSYSAPITNLSHLAMNNLATFNYIDYKLNGIDGFALPPELITDQTPNVPDQDYSDLSYSATGHIDSVELSGGVSAGFTQSTLLTQFAGNDVDIPCVSSGSAYGALDLAYQLTGNRRCTLTNGTTGTTPTGVFWSLRGHEAGFDQNNALVYGRDDTKYVTVYTNQTVRDQDDGSNQAAANAQNVSRMWAVRNQYSSSQWAALPDGIYSSAGVGSSVTVTPGRSSLILFTARPNGSNIIVKFGNATDFGFGPDASGTSTGKRFAVTISPTSRSVNVYGIYRKSGTVVTVNVNADLTPLQFDSNSQFRIAVVSGWTTASQYQLSVSIQPVGSTGAPVFLTTGPLSTGVDKWSLPWSHTGNIRSLYTTTAPTDSLNANTFTTAAYELDPPLAGNLVNAGIQTNAPILANTGNLWDYLCQVAVANQLDLRLNSANQITIDQSSQRGQIAKVWHPADNPSFKIDSSNVASYIDIEQAGVVMSNLATLYDGLVAGDDFSFPAGTTTTFSIQLDAVGDYIVAPEPVDDIASFRNIAAHPNGAYVVSGGDNLPILSAEWVSFGGSVTVRRSGLTSLDVTVVSPAIPGVDGDYSLSVSDGDNSYTCLRLVGQRGGKIQRINRRFYTGAEIAWAPSLTGNSVTNVAATNGTVVNTLGHVSAAFASGPSLNLSGNFPLEDVRDWDFADLWFVPGSVILYRNVPWRIMSSTLSETGVSFEAAYYATYDSTYWHQNWDGFTVGDFKLFWEDKQYDDYKTMVLSGIDLDWSSTGAVSKWTQYPSDVPYGITGVAVEPDNALLPALSTIPGQSFLSTDPGTGTGVPAVFPSSTTVPSATNPGTALNPGATVSPSDKPVYPQSVDPNSGPIGGAIPISSQFPSMYPTTYPSGSVWPGSDEEPNGD